MSKLGHAQSVSNAQVIVDVRTAEEFHAGHVPGAKNIPVQEIKARLQELGAKDTPLVLYCRSGARSGVVAAELRSLGYTNIKDIGPMSAWRG